MLRLANWGVIAFAAALQLGDGFDLVAMSFAAPPVARQLDLSHAQLGVLLSMAQFGSLIGAALVAAAGPRLPRRRGMALAAATVGLGALASALSTSYPVFLASRTLTGVGLGAVLPLVVTYAVRLSPGPVRGLVAAVAMGAQMAGSMIAGVFAAMLIQTLGWPSLFLAGAAGPLVLAAVVWHLPQLPEDLRRLGGPEAEVVAVEARYDLTDAEAKTAPAEAAGRTGRAAPLLALIVATASVSLVGYFVISWTPTLLQLNGLSPAAAALCSSCFSAGAIVGVVACGPLMDRWSPYLVIGIAALAAEVPLMALGWAGGAPAAIFALFFLLGAAVMGSVSSEVGFANLMFPVHWRVRTTALVGGLSRLAGLIAPAGAGLLLSQTATSADLFNACGWLLLVSAAAMIIPGLVTRRGKQR
jgi:AAHS family 4-hydroxybenzoate transporter-like MFS transporter